MGVCDCAVCFCVFFFFSSRRRHTRCYRDWSSDVCSSDLVGGNGGAGDRFAVTTIRGEARAWIDGRWVIGPAKLQLVVQVTYVGPHNIVFKVLSGTFQVNYKPYTIDVGHWRGDYNRDTHTAVYQGPATAPD